MACLPQGVVEVSLGLMPVMKDTMLLHWSIINLINQEPWILKKYVCSDQHLGTHAYASPHFKCTRLLHRKPSGSPLSVFPTSNPLTLSCSLSRSWLGILNSHITPPGSYLSRLNSLRSAYSKPKRSMTSHSLLCANWGPDQTTCQKGGRYSCKSCLLILVSPLTDAPVVHTNNRC